MRERIVRKIRIGMPGLAGGHRACLVRLIAEIVIGIKLRRQVRRANGLAKKAQRNAVPAAEEGFEGSVCLCGREFV